MGPRERFREREASNSVTESRRNSEKQEESSSRQLKTCPTWPIPRKLRNLGFGRYLFDLINGNEDVFFTMPAKDTVALDDDVELRTVALASPLNRTMVKDAIYTEESIETAKGKVLVAFAGDRKKPAILTFHDLGLNYISNFQASNGQN